MTYLHPRYWLVWLGLALLRGITFLPWRAQMALGKALGKVFYALLKKRRNICCINLELAFPELSPSEREQLNRQHFISLAQGFFEAAMSWWSTEKTLKPLLHTEGESFLADAFNSGKPIILLSAHFTSLELGGRLLTLQQPNIPLHVVYRPHQNKLIESQIAKIRTKRYGKAIPKLQIREMIKSLKGGFPLWYAQDQSYMGKNSVVVPFFGVPTATNSATSRFAAISGATVIPFFTVRISDSGNGKDKGKERGYLLKFLPPIDNFPSDNIEQDTLRINQLIESQIKEFPEQYLWTHKRFKTKDKDFYQHYSEDNPETKCQ
ncbi:MAG: lipid A biosynthesis lauroyl acyltransferase [Thiotrichaceae bacterium]